MTPDLAERRWHRSRGFTLLEVMAALLVASILAAAALPTMSQRLRDRRAQQSAQQVALFFREARTRAIGRGTSHLVRFSRATDPRGEMTMFEAVQAIGGPSNLGSCQNQPRIGTDSCASVVWGASAESRQVARLEAPLPLYEEVYRTFTANGADQATVDICFSPGGRSFLRTTANGPFDVFTGVQHVIVQRRDASNNPIDALVRDVIVLPNGATRVESTVTGGF